MISHHLVGIYRYTLICYVPIRPTNDYQLECVIMYMQLISV
jgi:hypothetical protein